MISSEHSFLRVDTLRLEENLLCLESECPASLFQYSNACIEGSFEGLMEACGFTMTNMKVVNKTNFRRYQAQNVNTIYELTYEGSND